MNCGGWILDGEKLPARIQGLIEAQNEVSALWFAVELILQTLAATNLGRLRVGARINVELDQIGKYPSIFTSINSSH